MRRFVALPLVLNAPRDILRFALLGAPVACLVNATIATAGSLGRRGLAPAGWRNLADLVGRRHAGRADRRAAGADADRPPARRLGAAPAHRRPAAAAGDWRCWRPAMLATAPARRSSACWPPSSATPTGWQPRRGALADAPLYALQALHSVRAWRAACRREALREARGLVAGAADGAAGHGLQRARARAARLPAFEAQARAEGLAGYRVFDRATAAAAAADGEVVALRLIEPRAGNAARAGRQRAVDRRRRARPSCSAARSGAAGGHARASGSRSRAATRPAS